MYWYSTFQGLRDNHVLFRQKAILHIKGTLSIVKAKPEVCKKFCSDMDTHNVITQFPEPPTTT